MNDFEQICGEHCDRERCREHGPGYLRLDTRVDHLRIIRLQGIGAKWMHYEICDEVTVEVHYDDLDPAEDGTREVMALADIGPGIAYDRDMFPLMGLELLKLARTWRLSARDAEATTELYDWIYGMYMSSEFSPAWRFWNLDGLRSTFGRYASRVNEYGRDALVLTEDDVIERLIEPALEKLGIGSVVL